MSVNPRVVLGFTAQGLFTMRNLILGAVVFLAPLSCTAPGRNV